MGGVAFEVLAPIGSHVNKNDQNFRKTKTSKFQNSIFVTTEKKIKTILKGFKSDWRDA